MGIWDMGENPRFVATDQPGNTRFFVIGEIDDDMVHRFIGPFSRAVDEQTESTRPKPLTIFVRGPGGEFDAFTTMLSLITIAQNSGLTIRTVVTGQVASASSMLAVSGTPGERYIADGAEHMLHYGWTFTEGEGPEELDRATAQGKRFFASVAAHYMKHAKIPDLKKNFDYDQYYIVTRKCLQWKLADKKLEDFRP